MRKIENESSPTSPTSLRMCSSNSLENTSVIPMKEIKSSDRHSSVREFTTYKESSNGNDLRKMTQLGTQFPGVNGA